MKKTEMIGIVGTGLLLAGLAVVLFIQIKANVLLRKELAQAKEEAIKAKAASRQLENLEKEIVETNRKAQEVYREVPEAEELPLSLVRGLGEVLAKTGLREVKYDLTQEEKQKKDENAGALAVAQDPEELSLQQKEMKKMAFTLSCIATFPQLIRFIDELEKFKRVTAVESVTVERDEKLLPYQRVAVKLVTFTFTKQ